MRKPSTWMLVLFAAVLFAALPAAADAPAALAAPAAVDAPADCAPPTEAAGDQEPLFLAGEICGSKICGKGTYCCNASCSLCVQFGMSCTQQVCARAQAVEDDRLDLTHGGVHFDQPCGNTVCTGNTFCCNASCSTCAPRGGYCTQQICPPTS
jgi:hypothetical protein